ncbi:DUF2312 domain-containing protein [Kiloniella sp.]|uniref:DUF2312 domain-containing protein n=1 Tax=Kiloniella sp. TaxID=1938587 RepID=UPI003B0264BA
MSEEQSPTLHHPDQVEAFDQAETGPDTVAAAMELAGAEEGAIVGVAADRLRGFMERVERLEEEKKAIADDIKEIKSEAKSLGFDIKIFNIVLSLRKIDQQERLEIEELTDVYKHALGMI